MSQSIYKTTDRINNAVLKLEENGFSERNIEAIKDFKRYLLANDLSEHRVNAYLQSFNTISCLIDFDLLEASRSDVMDLVMDINQDNFSDTDHSVWSICEYKKAVKKFYQWREKEDKPEIVDFISTHPRESEKPKVSPDELLDVGEVEALIQSCSNSRDKAFFGMLWDSGARIGELLALEWRDISFEDDIMRVHLRNGKNGPRKIMLVESIPLIRQWMSDYPGRCRPDNPVWIALRQGGRKDKRQVTYRSIRSQVSKAVDESSISETKKTNPHAWRKARATDLAKKGLSQANLELWFGWCPGSDKSKFYIWLAHSDLDYAFRRLYDGLDEKKEEGPKYLGENLDLYDQSDLRKYGDIL